MTKEKKTKLVDMLTRPENLHWAWLKARNIYDYADFWFDEAEVSEFDACLQSKLDDIAAQFRNLTYEMSPLRPLPYPKQLNQDDSDGVKLRQMFHISVRDQVAWIAFVNVVGPWMESQMPPWSYGNRLYQARWSEETDKGFKLNIGPHRHARGKLYRTFGQSWPVFRRHIFLTVRAMTNLEKEVADLTPADRNVLEAENTLPTDEKLDYLKAGYWGESAKEVFWAGLDIKKFYPNLSCELILKHLSKAKPEYNYDIGNLGKSLLNFPVDYMECGDAELEKMGLDHESKVFKGLPTGLFVAGFLANVAMLGVDAKVASQLDEQRESGKPSIAHFRYVDDHVVLARCFENLKRWVNSYEEMLQEHSPTLTINQNKLQPEEFKLLKVNTDREKEEKKRQKAKKACSVDPRYPAPLITKTLGMVSNLAQVQFDILDSREREHFIADLEHLLLAEFPDHEIREVTRVSFAAGRLANSGARRSFFSFEISELEREMTHLSMKLHKFQKNDEKLKNATRNKIKALERIKQKAEETLHQQREREQKRIMSLLVQAVKKHPEKLKLWTAALEFCRRTGHDGLSLIADELNTVEQTSAEAGSYIRAFLWQKMARQIMKSTKQGLMSVKEMDISHASDSLVYPFELPHKLLTLVSETRAPRFFESSSWQWLRSTLDAFRTETLGVLNSLSERPHLDKMVIVQRDII